MAWSKNEPAEGYKGAESFFAESPRLRVSASLIIAVSIILVTVLHFLTPVDQIVWHEIYQRLYYIPIIAAALLFGLRGGLATSVFTTLVYSPHIYLHWQQGHFDYSINQYAEIVIFNVVGSVMGALGDRLKQARERAERNAAERQAAYDELQKTFEQLLQAEKLSSLGELSAGIVHEVRNPLGSIKGAIEIIEDELAETSPRREFAAIAKTEVERIDKLVSEFLHFARSPKPRKAPTDINKLVNSVRLLIEKQAAAQNVSIVENFVENLPAAALDAGQIKQVLLNLALNALQAMPTGGELVFSTRTNKKNVIIEVSDTGAGIDESNLRRIFDPFFSTKDKSLGLGLSIAYKIVAEHGGNLSGENSQNGAIFRLEIPLII